MMQPTMKHKPHASLNTALGNWQLTSAAHTAMTLKLGKTFQTNVHFAVAAAFLLSRLLRGLPGASLFPEASAISSPSTTSWQGLLANPCGIAPTFPQRPPPGRTATAA